MDAFSAQIVKFVRHMPDDALLELVKQKLGILGAAAAGSKGRGKTSEPAWPTPARAARVAPGAPKAAKGKRVAPAKRRRTSAPRRAAVSVERQGMLDNVERVVKAGAGVSASDVAKLASVPQTRPTGAYRPHQRSKHHGLLQKGLLL